MSTRLRNLERDVGLIKTIMQQKWPQYFERKTAGGVVAPDGVDLSQLKEGGS